MKHEAKDRKHWKWMLCVAVVLAIGALGVIWQLWPKNSEGVAAFDAKADLLAEQMLSEQMHLEMGTDPLGEVGYGVFFSVCDGTQRAGVYCGTGADLDTAWEAARKATEEGLRKSGTVPIWVKADAAYLSETISASELESALTEARPEYFHYGVALDGQFETALLEAELNGAKIYDYENGGLDLIALNRYLKEAGRQTLEQLPESYTLFRCFSRFCDENDTIYQISADSLDYGRRRVDTVDQDYAAQLISNASDFLVSQMKGDGQFVYGWYPRFDNEIKSYNIVRHASTIWALLCRYRMSPSDELAETIRKAINYMTEQIVYNGDDTAYLYEAESDEIKLGGCGIAVVVLCEYMDVFGSDRYTDLCRALGNGILTMFNGETGCYYHVLNGDFSRKEETRTVYYDGEATFALCKLYGLTKEEQWLNAAKIAVNHFIEADYTQYCDHWVAYTMNEITKYVTDDPNYYAFALQNAQYNLEKIYSRDTTYHTYLELLMETFELYDRMNDMGAVVEGFDLEGFLLTIKTRAERQLNGYFFPEVAMYMKNPQRILNTFMVRHDGFRVRIDDVQHNIGGYYLYWKNYDKLVAYGMATD